MKRKRVTGTTDAERSAKGDSKVGTAEKPTSTALLSSARVCEILGVKSQTLRAMRLRGTGPRYIRLGGRHGRAVYRSEEVEKWLSQRSFDSTSQEKVADAARRCL